MLLKVPEFSFGALGGFAMEGDKRDQAAFFLYVTLNADARRPAVFFITGLAAGLGFTAPW